MESGGTDKTASYLRLAESGELSRRAAEARERLVSCGLCPNLCLVDRTEAAEGAVSSGSAQGAGPGACRSGRLAVISGYGPHHGEEDCLRGWAGSGTVFFSHCNLSCVFCQNWETSHQGVGRAVTAADLAGIWLDLQARGCHNINLVSPSHVVAQILEALEIAADEGLRLPLVYNSGGYDSLETLRLLDGVVDIYMPDMKYGDSETGRRLSGIADYREVNQAAVREMHRQAGDLRLDAQGLAYRGLLVRHLILPGNLAGTETVLRFLVEEISPFTCLNLMDQYRPCFEASHHPPLDRPLERAEYREMHELARRIGLQRVI